MLRSLSLIVMVIVFALSQNSNLLVSFIKHNKAEVTYIADSEENTEMEKEEMNADQICYDFFLNPNVLSYQSFQKHYLNAGNRLISSDKSSPETPPPNVV